MKYKYSVCYPNQEKIQYIDEPITSDQVLSIAKNHNWLEQLQLAKTLGVNNLYYNPSIAFTAIENNHSIEITADLNSYEEIEFSIWYKRPKKVKILYGLFGAQEKLIIDDVWHIDFDQTIQYLQHFLSEEYQILENLINYKS